MGAAAGAPALVPADIGLSSWARTASPGGPSSVLFPSPLYRSSGRGLACLGERGSVARPTPAVPPVGPCPWPSWAHVWPSTHWSALPRVYFSSRISPVLGGIPPQYFVFAPGASPPVPGTSAAWSQSSGSLGLTPRYTTAAGSPAAHATSLVWCAERGPRGNPPRCLALYVARDGAGFLPAGDPQASPLQPSVPSGIRTPPLGCIPAGMCLLRRPLGPRRRPPAPTFLHWALGVRSPPCTAPPEPRPGIKMAARPGGGPDPRALLCPGSLWPVQNH